MSHLYVHVPFCVRRCSYCDFSIAVRKQIPARQYVDCILAEARSAGVPRQLETLYFGGGTPSLLPVNELARLVATLGPAGEVTLEANPEDVSPANAAAWRAAGINRVSLGAQSFDDAVLAWMHRSHDAAQTARAVRTLRDAGIENLSLDLIFALPDELARDWGRDLDLALALQPSHLSLYGLTVEPRTPLERWISRGRTAAPNEERYAEEYLAAHRRLRGAGYEFYEVSNAARPGFRSRHNAAYWSGRAYVGLGPAAHSFDGLTRRWNLRAWEAYRRAVLAGGPAVESEETLTDEQRETERLYLGLRTMEGVAAERLRGGSAPLRAFEEAGWVRTDAGRLKCTPEGWLRLDSIVNEYDSATH